MAFQTGTDWCNNNKKYIYIYTQGKNQDKHLGWAELASMSHIPANDTENSQGSVGTQLADVPWPDGHWSLTDIPHTDQLENKLWQSTHIPHGKQVRMEINVIALSVWRLQPRQLAAVRLRRHLHGNAQWLIWETKAHPNQSNPFTKPERDHLIKATWFPHLKAGQHCPAYLVQELPHSRDVSDVLQNLLSWFWSKVLF